METDIEKANIAQVYLLENNLNDLVLNDNEKPKNWIYTSDIMMSFIKETSDNAGDLAK